MAFTAANSIDVTDLANFIPELWSTEIIAAYKENLVLTPLVVNVDHVGKKGDVLHIPKPARGTANAKSANTEVTVQAFTATEETITIDKHYEYSRFLEDIAKLQAIDSYRQFITDDAGFQLAKQQDTDLADLAKTWGGGTDYDAAVIGDGSTVFVDNATPGASNASSISDAGLRTLVQGFNDNDVPTRNRYLAIPPVTLNTFQGTARYTEQAFVGEVGSANTIRNGLVGDLYGVDIYVSNNLGTAVQDTDARVALFFHRDAMAIAKQMNVQMETQRKLEFLADLMVAHQVYGVRTLRGRIAGEDGLACRAILVDDTA